MRRKWYEQLASYLESKGRRRMIYRRPGEDYLERFYVFSSKWLGIYLHRFWADDDDGLHDHPWNSVSIVLQGSYYEEMPERQAVPYGPTIIKLRRPRRPWFFMRSKHSAHRITIPEGEEGTWTIFIRFGFSRRQWGFYRNRGWEACSVQSRREESNVSS